MRNICYNFSTFFAKKLVIICVLFYKNPDMRIFLLMLFLSASAVFAQSNPSNQSGNNLEDLAIVRYPVALLQVLSEICPALLPKDEQSRFVVAHEAELKERLPMVKDPKQLLIAFNNEPEYQSVLASVRTWTLSFAKSENAELCHEFALDDKR